VCNLSFRLHKDPFFLKKKRTLRADLPWLDRRGCNLWSPSGSIHVVSWIQSRLPSGTIRGDQVLGEIRNLWGSGIGGNQEFVGIRYWGGAGICGDRVINHQVNKEME
jgi:hypothetical protein